jgi:hypothetical protein
MDVQEPIQTDPTAEVPPVGGTESTTGEEGKPGGRTAAGSEKSRRNALGLGLTATEVFPAHLESSIGKIQGELTEHYEPKSGIEQRLIREMAVNWAKLEYCEDLRKLDIDRVIQRVGLCWDSDQQAIADQLYGRLPRRPELVAPALARTRHGADRLVTDLKMLATIVKKKGALTERQHHRLYNLFGVPVDMRDGSDRVPPANDGPAILALIAAEVERLEQLQVESLIDLDEQRKVLVLAAMPYAADAETKQLKRYETTIRNNLERAREEFRRVRAEAAAAEEVRRKQRFRDLAMPPRVEEPAETGAPDASPKVRKRVFITPPMSPPFVVERDDRTADDLKATLFGMDPTRTGEHAGPSVFRKSAHREPRGPKDRRR